MSEKILEIKNMTTTLYTKTGAVTPIEHISFFVDKGEMLGIVGESGCGKSITVQSVMRLINRDAGMVKADSIQIGGYETAGYTEKQMCSIRGKEIAMIFQEPMTSLNPTAKVGAQICEPLMIHQRMKKPEAMIRTRKLLEEVGIKDIDRVINDYPYNLSGGMRQRVMIAIAMACDPKLLLADEPTTALDVTIQAQIMDELKELQRQGTGVILVTHDLGLIAEYCDRVLVMYCGMIVEEANVTEIFKNPLHPYTKGLISCIPRMDVDTEMLPCITGNVLPVREFKENCRFAPRCHCAVQKCFEAIPELREIIPGHKCRCFCVSEH